MLAEVPWDVLVILVTLGLLSEVFVHTRVFSRLAVALSERSAGDPRRLLPWLAIDPYQLDGLVAYDDPATREIVGWAYGNCVHCHDGSGGPLASFSMRPGSFLANTIDRPTEGSASGVGLRIAPGRPDESALLLAVQGGDEPRGLAPMPPLGVEVRDEAAIARLRDWIAGLPVEE